MAFTPATIPGACRVRTLRAPTTSLSERGEAYSSHGPGVLHPAEGGRLYRLMGLRVDAVLSKNTGVAGIRREA